MGQGFQVSLYGLLSQDQLIALLDKLAVLSGQIEPQVYDVHEIAFIPRGKKTPRPTSARVGFNGN